MAHYARDQRRRSVLEQARRPTAERYLLFDVVAREKAARNYQEFAVRLGERALSKRTLQRLRTTRSRLERRFGSSSPLASRDGRLLISI